MKLISKKLLIDKQANNFHFLNKIIGVRFIFPINWKVKAKSRLEYGVSIIKELFLLLFLVVTRRQSEIIIITGSFLKYGDSGGIEFSTEKIASKIKVKG